MAVPGLWLSRAIHKFLQFKPKGRAPEYRRGDDAGRDDERGQRHHPRTDRRRRDLRVHAAASAGRGPGRHSVRCRLGMDLALPQIPNGRDTHLRLSSWASRWPTVTRRSPIRQSARTRCRSSKFRGMVKRTQIYVMSNRWGQSRSSLAGHRYDFVNQRTPSVPVHSQTERDNEEHADSRLACNQKQNPWRAAPRRTSATNCRQNGRRIASCRRRFEGNAPRHRRFGKAMDIPDGAERGSRKIAE